MTANIDISSSSGSSGSSFAFSSAYVFLANFFLAVIFPLLIAFVECPLTGWVVVSSRAICAEGQQMSVAFFIPRVVFLLLARGL